jgi:hypothetical protein
MITKAISCTYWFESSSGTGLHETLKYVDGTTSCSCKGWCRRISDSGHRSCKHTRLVDAGIAELEAYEVRREGLPTDGIKPRQSKGKATTHNMPQPGQRKIITS